MSNLTYTNDSAAAAVAAVVAWFVSCAAVPFLDGAVPSSLSFPCLMMVTPLVKKEVA